MRRSWALLLLLPLAGCSKLSSVLGPSGQCAGPQPYTIGSTVTGTLGQNECKGPSELSGHIYTFALTAQTNFSVTMTPSGFEGEFGLYSSNTAVVPEQKHGGPIVARAFLPLGSYTLVAGRSKGSKGDYSLTTQPAALDGCQSDITNWITPGANVTGVVADTDCQAAGTGRQDIYEIVLASSQTLTVSVAMDQAGAFALFTGSSAVLARNVAKGGASSFTYTAPSAGSYRVHVQKDQGPPVNYTMNVR